MRWAAHVASVWEIRKIYKILVRNPVRKRLVGRPRYRCEDNNKMDLKE